MLDIQLNLISIFDSTFECGVCCGVNNNFIMRGFFQSTTHPIMTSQHFNLAGQVIDAIKKSFSMSVTRM